MNASAQPDQLRDDTRQTLGDLLYARVPSGQAPDEREWVQLVQAMACGHARALQALYECSHRALGALPAGDMEAIEAHIEGCRPCHRQMQRLRPLMETFVYWPTDVLRPGVGVWRRQLEGLPAHRSAYASPFTSLTAAASAAPAPGWSEPPWKQVAPGISCKTLAMDRARQRLTLLVRLAPGISYPPHRHDGVEELHMIDGELWIEERKLRPGDYNRAEPGSTDRRVWTETGCTCLLITSSRDVLL